MKSVVNFLLIIIFAGCSQHSDTKGVIYSGKAKLNIQLREFMATNEEDDKKIILTMTGSKELTINFNDTISHIDYEKDVIIFRSETDKSEWTAKKVKGGFELEDGTLLRYGNCQGWTICLLEESTQLPILKGAYSLSGNNVTIELWISEGEKHVELLGVMANGLFNKSRNEKAAIDSSLETLSNQVWTY
jgi:hypothetical protein